MAAFKTAREPAATGTAARVTARPPDPQDGDAQDRANGLGTKGETTEQSPEDIDAGYASQMAAALRKKRETLAARLALRGFELRATDTGTYIVSRWNMSRHASDLDAVEAFTRQVGA